MHLWFQPEVAVYLTRDPIGYADGPNVYLYVHNSPINHIDPLGLQGTQASAAGYNAQCILEYKNWRTKVFWAKTLHGGEWWKHVPLYGGEKGARIARGRLLVEAGKQAENKYNPKKVVKRAVKKALKDELNNLAQPTSDTPTPEKLAEQDLAEKVVDVVIDEAAESLTNPEPPTTEEGKPSYPRNADDWEPPEGWVETSAGEKTEGRHRQWVDEEGKMRRRWDASGREGGKERGEHWHDLDDETGGKRHTDPDDWGGLSMISRLENCKSGWVDVSLSLGAAEVAGLIELLNDLKESRLDHFHLTATDFSAVEGIANVEFSLKGEAEEDNMSVG